VNILVTTGIFPPDVGGPAKFVPLIADKLSEKNNLKVITLSEKNVEYRQNDYEVFRIIRNQNKVSRFIKTLVLIIKNGKDADVIFVNGLWLEVYISNWFIRKKTIRKIVGDPVWEKFYTQYKTDDDFDTFQEKKYNTKVQFLKFVRNTALKSSNTIIVPSYHLLDFVKKQGYNGRLIQVNNGTEKTKSIKKNKADNKFLIVSRLVRHKNIDLVLKSLVILKNEYKIDFTLNIVGEGPEHKSLINLINKLGLQDSVNIVGAKYGEELKSFYQFSNYFLQLSSYEGMPHSILEAMNYELKIIASNFGGNFELLGDNDFGFTSPSLDIETVANTIYTAIKDSSDMTAKSKELVNKHYNIENTINKFSEIILDNE